MLSDIFSQYGPSEEEEGVGDGWQSSYTGQSNDFVFLA